MPEENRCPECSKPLPAGSPRGLCPACLLQRGLEANTAGYTDETRARWTPPAIEQLAPLFPELDILELIGRGGMGAVYKARQKELDRLVALKILPPEIGRDAGFAQRFAREAQAMAKLGHPHIVTIHDFGQREALYFFIMEYIDGLSLRQLLDRGAVSPKEALAIVPQICDALQYAHDRGIVHRDIKPENILLNRQGQVKIADFGLAKLVGGTGGEKDHPGSPARLRAAAAETAGDGKVMGTPQYMAPEQMERPGEVDHRADIYSLGVVFYQMLTGELPKGRFEPPSRKVLIDVRLDEVVLKALEKEPERRYQQVSEVKTEVETIVATAGPSHGPVHPAIYGWEYRSKRTLFGLPLVHVADGYDPATGKPREACGIIAYGGKAKGVIAIGGRAVGVIAFGGLAVGIVALGGLSLGLLSFGGLVAGLLFGYGGVVLAPVAVGGIAAGYYSQGGFNFSVHRLDAYGIIVYASILFYSLLGALLVAMACLAAVGRRCRPRPQHNAAQAGVPDSTRRLSPETGERMERARRAVKAPAIGLLVSAGVNLAVILVLGTLGYVVVFFKGLFFFGGGPTASTADYLWLLFCGILGLVVAGFVLCSSIRMLKLKGRAAAITGSILAATAIPAIIATLPIWASNDSGLSWFLLPVFLIGLPIGIWALVVLSRREVVEAFAASRGPAAPSNAQHKPQSTANALMRVLWTVLIHGTLLGLACFIATFFVPRLLQIFNEPGTSLPTSTVLTLQVARIIYHWWFALLFVDAGVCFLLQRFVGSRAHRGWSWTITVLMVLLLILGLLALLLPVIAHTPKSAPQPADDETAVRQAAGQFLAALKDKDLEAAKALSLGSVTGWVSDEQSRQPGRGQLAGLSARWLGKAIREMHEEVYPDNPDLMTRIEEVAVLDDFAAVKVPQTRVPAKYIIFIFTRTDSGWRFVTGDDADKPLAEELAARAPRVRELLGVPPAPEGATVPLATVSDTEVSRVVYKAVTGISTMQESDPRVAELLSSLRKLAWPPVVSELAKYLDSDKNTILRAAIFILWKGEFSDISAAVPALTMLTSHQEEYTRGMAALALGEAKVTQAFDRLASMAVDDKSAYARRAAVYALGLLVDQRAKPVLEKALKDSDFNVRNNAEAALTLLGKWPASPPARSEVGPMATAEAFMAAVAAGNDRDAMQMADPASAVPHQIADFHNLSNLKSLRLAQMHADDSSAMGATIPFEVEQRGKKETVVLQLTLTKSRGLWVVSDIDLKTPEIAKQSLDEFLAAHPKADVAWPPPPVSPAPDTKDLTEQVKAWVEDFFRHNYKDITRRETIEWGQAEALADGNLSIRYKYLATIRDKDKQVIEEVFTFAPDGKFVSVKKLGAAPAVTAAQIDWIQTACRRAEEFLASLRQGKPAEAYAHTTQEYRRGHEGGLERLAELMDLSKAKPVQVCVAMEAACVVVSPVSPVFPKGRDTSLGLGMIRVGENYLIRDIDLLPVDKAVKRFVDGFRSAYPAATGSYRPGPEPEPSSSSDRSPPAEANPSSER